MDKLIFLVERNVVLIFGLLLGLFVLASCASSDPSNPPTTSGGIAVTNINVNGHDVACVTWKYGYAGGISCNWEAYNAGK